VPLIQQGAESIHEGTPERFYTIKKIQDMGVRKCIFR